MFSDCLNFSPGAWCLNSHQKAGCSALPGRLGLCSQQQGVAAVTASCFLPVARVSVSSARAVQALELRDALLPCHGQDGEAFVPEVSEPFHHRGSTVSLYFQSNSSSAPTLGLILCVQGRCWQSRERNPTRETPDLQE